MFVKGITVLDWVNWDNLIPSAINIFQPEEQTVTHFMKVLWDING